MTRRRRSRIVRGVLVGLVVLLVAGGLALATLDRWLFTVLDPGPFDPARTPTAPDYAQPTAWAARPATTDAADVALPSHPAIDPSAAPADVFYLHPTTWLGREWNAPFDDPEVAEATARGGTLIQASAFNACCAVYAPRYRQANGRAFVQPDPHGHRAIDVAYADVSAAFDQFLTEIGERPFIIAGHSQGAMLGARLLRERVGGTSLRSRLVAAYLVGAPVRPEGLDGRIPVCAHPLQTGCVVSYNARSLDYRANGMELDAQRLEPLRGVACLNPISWRADGQFVPAERHGGAVFLDAPSPAVKEAFTAAQCVDGTLHVDPLGDLERDWLSRLLLWTMGPGNYHPVEFQLFYLDLRANALARVDAFLASPPATGPTAP